MQLTSAECFMTKVLDCGYADLDLLDNIYSKLAEECCDVDDVINFLQASGNLSLNSLLYDVYHYIKCEITEQARNTVNKDDMFAEFLEETGLNESDINKEDLIDCITDVEDSAPYTNCLDSCFNSDIDQTVDFDKSITENVYALLKYFVKCLEKQEV